MARQITLGQASNIHPLADILYLRLEFSSRTLFIVYLTGIT